MARLSSQKLTKFRKSPRAFFSDSPRGVMRMVGRWVGPHLEASEWIMDLLEDPIEALKARPLARLVHGFDVKRRAERQRIIRDADSPTVSLIMAAFNAADSIDRALDSVLGQSYENIELVVIDDASQDDTAERVAKRAESDSRLRLVRQAEQQGPALARNAGLNAASGDFLTFHDADDVSHPERIERQLAALLRSEGAALCVCNCRRETPDGERVFINGSRFGKNVLSMMFPRKPVFERVGFMLDLPVGEDSDYYERIRAAFGSDAEVHLFQTLYRARFLPDSQLFSDGRTRVSDDGHHVTHTPSPEAETGRRATLERAALISAGRLDPYVPPSGHLNPSA